MNWVSASGEVREAPRAGAEKAWRVQNQKGEKGEHQIITHPLPCCGLMFKCSNQIKMHSGTEQGALESRHLGRGVFPMKKYPGARTP